MDLRIIREDTDESKKNVNERLYYFNLAHFPEDLRGRYEEVNLFIKDEKDQVLGGIMGEVCWNWLEIHVLIMDESLRKNGYGSKLLMEAEEIAKERKCDFIKLDTLSFQALEFYKKHGYEVYGTLPYVGRDFDHYYMKKDLMY
ncbi:GNAT family N-acetyltransferase [uncultured Psychrobacillus sp.]|uniref:GNAT family N-acetyltransferase n=1 Tax=uncultured Psychrobacillus sp. TaxID=1551585 RepID=UPI00261F42AA|nr:GNAT family N-acetyltransferase [uncultured Psychrobacillus sp.]